MPSPNIRIIYCRLLSDTVRLKPAPADRLPTVVLQSAETAQLWRVDAEKKAKNIEYRTRITQYEIRIHCLFTLQEHPVLLKSGRNK